MFRASKLLESAQIMAFARQINSGSDRAIGQFFLKHRGVRQFGGEQHGKLIFEISLPLGVGMLDAQPTQRGPALSIKQSRLFQFRVIKFFFDYSSHLRRPF